MPTLDARDSRATITNELAIEIAKLGMVRDSSEMGALGRLTDLAARAVTGCAGATTIRWSLTDPPEAVAAAASHPDLAELIEVQRVRREGPSFSAVTTREPVMCEDTLVETRWPEYVGAALRRGVRCFATTLYANDRVLLTLGLYGVLPGSLDPRQLAVAELLVAQSGAAVTNSREYDDVHRTAEQLRQAVEARAVVDQAKGILMHALGCDAETAFAELRRISQTRHVKLTAVARRIVAGERVA
ncbi:MAG TPA: GAF and ANTAR domain-containing protein [Streptosporangiaceae bacterium]